MIWFTYYPNALIHIFRKSYSFIWVRSSHQICSVRKGVLRNFAKFIRKHLCQILFFNKVAGQVLFCEFCRVSKNAFFTEHLRVTTFWECSIPVSILNTVGWSFTKITSLQKQLKECQLIENFYFEIFGNI